MAKDNRRRHLSIEARAIAEGWPNPPEKKKALMERLYEIALDPNTGDRVVGYIADKIFKGAALNIAEQQVAQDQDVEARRQATLEVFQDPEKLTITHRESVMEFEKVRTEENTEDDTLLIENSDEL